MSDAKRDFDVVVVGCGTTGLTLARLLTSAGVRVAVVDRWRLPVSYPRATHLDDEIMRVFQTLGLAHMEPGFTGVGFYRFVDPKGRVVMEFDMHLGLTTQGWQSDYMFQQPDWESAMRGLVQESSVGTTFFGFQLLEVEDTGEAAHLLLREGSSGEETRISASYVVGCDGANSAVRRLMASEQIDFHATHRSLIVDIKPFVSSPNLPDNLDSFIRGGIRNPITYLSIAQGQLRFEWLLRPDDDANEFERPNRIYELLSEWFRPSEYRIARADVYQWRAVLSDPWRDGRIFIAGDACHEMPPHLGQGMCSGVRDATNLAWKLPLVIRGEASPDLLDTYESERSPHVRVIVETAGMMANQIEAMEELPPHIEPPPVEERGAIRPPMGPGIFNDGDRWAGTLAEQPRLADGTLLDDVVGFRFALVGNPANLGDISQESEALLDRLDVRVVSDSSAEVEAWLGRLEVGAVLVRPDRYVCGTATSPSEAADLITRLESQLLKHETAVS
jgi:3-(3-hydroxy-phenyl)propionate hydroxylase